jgi:hypothetical protein
LFVGFFVDDIILFAFFFSRKGGRFEWKVFFFNPDL